MKTMKKIAVLAVALTLSTGALFAQHKVNEFPGQPKANEFQPSRGHDVPEIRVETSNPGKLLGIIDSTTANSLTFIDMDGKKVTVAITPFTDIQDLDRVRNVDPKAKDAREQYKRTYFALSQLHKGYWVDIKAFKTAGGKLVAEHIYIIRLAGGDK